MELARRRGRGWGVNQEQLPVRGYLDAFDFVSERQD